MTIFLYISVLRRYIGALEQLGCLGAVDIIKVFRTFGHVQERG